jgi:acylphosphatase
MTAIRLRISGRVQGVGFRWFVREAARAAGLAGWVRNNPDGSVEVAVSGPFDAVTALRETLRQGPPGAHVSRVEELAAPDHALPEPFTVHR